MNETSAYSNITIAGNQTGTVVDPKAEVVYWWRILLVVIFQICTAYFNGMNLGVMSLDVRFLEILAMGPFETK